MGRRAAHGENLTALFSLVRKKTVALPKKPEPSIFWTGSTSCPTSARLDAVRAQETKELKAKGYEPLLTKTRWLLLKRQNLTDKQGTKLSVTVQSQVDQELSVERRVSALLGVYLEILVYHQIAPMKQGRTVAPLPSGAQIEQSGAEPGHPFSTSKTPFPRQRQQVACFLLHPNSVGSKHPLQRAGSNQVNP